MAVASTRTRHMSSGRASQHSAKLSRSLAVLMGEGSMWRLVHCRGCLAGYVKLPARAPGDANRAR